MYENMYYTIRNKRDINVATMRDQLLTIILAKIKIFENTVLVQHTQTHLPRKQQQKGAICLWVAGKVTESSVRAEQVVPSLTSPPQTVPQHSKVGCPSPQ